MRRTALLLAALGACSPPVGPPDADAEAGADADDGGEPDGSVLPCTANGDWVIERSEAPVALGQAVALLVSSGEVPVDLTGTVVGGRRTWRFETELPGDRVVEEAALDPAGHWFAESFPSASYAAPVAGFPGGLGLYAASADGIALLGIASEADDSTLVRYEPPLEVARFPLREGDHWTVTSRGTGRLARIAFNSVETLEVEVDAAGDAVVPAGVFPVLRVRMELDRLAGPLSERRVSHTMLAECWGRVAAATSRSGETEAEFTVAEQLTRLTHR